MSRRAPLTPGFLSKKGGRYRAVKMMELVTLIHNVMRGVQLPNEVGFEDANRSLDSLFRRLNKKVLIEPGALESMLWSANLMDERGEFWDVKERPFDQFIRELLGSDKFDRRYNMIKKKGSIE